MKPNKVSGRCGGWGRRRTIGGWALIVALLLVVPTILDFRPTSHADTGTLLAASEDGASLAIPSSPGGIPPSTQTDGDRWTNLTPIVSPGQRWAQTMVYDSRSDRAIMHGGDTAPAGVYLADTWAYDYDTNAWTEMGPTVGPPPLRWPGMAYDSHADRTIMWGGCGIVPVPGVSCQAYHTTWAYDYVNNTWTDRRPATSPRGADEPSMIYDSQSDRVILFGGWENGNSDDTWAYNYETNTWTNMSPATRPSARWGFGLAYDSSWDRIILFSGTYSTALLGGAGNDTWAYDYDTNTWTNLTPATAPSARYAPGMVYDPPAGRVIMFGGWDSRGRYLNDTWAYDGDTNTWTLMTLAKAPAPRVHATMVYDTQSNRSILFGGVAASVSGFDNETWSFRTTAGSPSPPIAVQAASGDASVQLTWQPPSDDGGSPVAKYSVYRGTTHGGESRVLELGNALMATDTGLTNGVTYYYFVTATNVLGEGVRSREVSATPAAPNTPPSAAFTITPSTGDVTTTFTVDASASTDTEDLASALQVRWSWQYDGTWDTPWSMAKTAEHQYTAAGTYTIRLQVRDTGGLLSTAAQSVVVSPPTLDTVRPTVTVTTPSDKAILEGTALTITGTASDNIAVRKVEVSLDNATWVAATGTNSWSADLTLAEGDNTIYVCVTDTSGNSATTTLTVTVVPPGGLPQWIWPAAVVVVGGAAVAAYVTLRRRKTLAIRPRPPDH